MIIVRVDIIRESSWHHVYKCIILYRYYYARAATAYPHEKCVKNPPRRQRYTYIIIIIILIIVISYIIDNNIMYYDRRCYIPYSCLTWADCFRRPRNKEPPVRCNKLDGSVVRKSRHCVLPSSSGRPRYTYQVLPGFAGSTYYYFICGRCRRCSCATSPPPTPTTRRYRGRTIYHYHFDIIIVERREKENDGSAVFNRVATRDHRI